MFNKYKNISNETFKMEFEILYADTRINNFLSSKKEKLLYIRLYIRLLLEQEIVMTHV